MQAVMQESYGGPEVLRLAECEQPSRRAGQLLVRVMASGVNRADLAQRAGSYPPPPGASPLLGLEVAGWVEEADADSRFQPGDAVFGLVEGGGYAEYALLEEALAIAKPDALSWVEAASLPEAWMTAWFNLVEKAGLAAGETALIHAGASGVGAAAIQLSGLLGARALATAGSEDKLAYCREMGAAAAFNYKRQDFAAEVKALGGADVVLDPVGAAYLDANVSALRPDGRLVCIGLLGGARADFNLGALLMKRIAILGSTLRPQPLAVKGRLARALEETILPALLDGRLRLSVDCSFPLAQVEDAHRYVEENRNLGKVVLTQFPTLAGE
nr:NAD(P)H-quinone oxidoreductase [Chromobacterium sp. ASV5]